MVQQVGININIIQLSDNVCAGDGDTPEAGDNRLYGHGVGVPVDPGGGAGGDWTEQHQPLSDIMPDIAMAGSDTCRLSLTTYVYNLSVTGATAAFSSLSLSRSVPATPPPSHQHPSLSPDVVEVAESGGAVAGSLRWSPRSSGVRSVPHSYRHGPSHMFL